MFVGGVRCDVVDIEDGLTIHVGSPDGLIGATALLLDWAAAAGLRWDMAPTEAGDAWGCRMESYGTDPRVQPAPSPVLAAISPH